MLLSLSLLYVFFFSVWTHEISLKYNHFPQLEYKNLDYTEEAVYIQRSARFDTDNDF